MEDKSERSHELAGLIADLLEGEDFATGATALAGTFGHVFAAVGMPDRQVKDFLKNVLPNIVMEMTEHHRRDYDEEDEGVGREH